MQPAPMLQQAVIDKGQISSPTADSGRMLIFIVLWGTRPARLSTSGVKQTSQFLAWQVWIIDRCAEPP